jgi:hypothetical protein
MIGSRIKLWKNYLDLVRTKQRSVFSSSSNVINKPTSIRKLLNDIRWSSLAKMNGRRMVINT